jgi:hypothetical protein
MRNFVNQSAPPGTQASSATTAAAVALLALWLGACSPTLSSLPKELGGMPADTPAPPATKLAYPAVHDMPPPRTKAVLTEDQLKQAEDELAAARDRQPSPPASPARNR